VILQRQLLGVAIEQIGLSRVGVATDVNEYEPLIPGAGREIDVHSRKLFLEEVVVRFVGFVLEIDARTIVDISGRD
jgi:hypothetical protein